MEPEIKDQTGGEAAEPTTPDQTVDDGLGEADGVNTDRSEILDDSGEDYSWLDEAVPDDGEVEFDRLMREEREGREEAPDEAADESESEEGEDKAGAESAAQDGEEAAEDGEPAPKSEWTKTVGALFGESFESDEAATERMRALKDENESFNDLRGLLKDNEQLGSLFVGLLEDGLDLREAAVKAIPGLKSEIPDKYDEPEAYADWKARLAKEETERQHQEQLAQQEAEKLARANADVDRAFASFVAEHDLDDEAKDAFQKNFILYRLGDPETGRIPPDIFEREWKAQNFDAEIERVRKEAHAAGKNEAIEQLTSRRGMRGDGVPALAGAGTAAKDLSAKERKEEARFRDFARDGHWDGSW